MINSRFLKLMLYLGRSRRRHGFGVASKKKENANKLRHLIPIEGGHMNNSQVCVQIYIYIYICANASLLKIKRWPWDEERQTVTKSVTLYHDEVAVETGKRIAIECFQYSHCLSLRSLLFMLGLIAFVASKSLAQRMEEMLESGWVENDASRGIGD